jgi:hypothetical protein
MQGEDLLAWYETSPGTHRGFCRVCGAKLLSRFDFDPGVYGLPLGALDDDPGVKPKRHVFVAYKAPWYDITDDLPQHEELPRMIRGSCLCGDVRFEIVWRPQSGSHCHCSMCRKAHGAAFGTYAAAKAAEFRFVSGEDRITRYRSSAEVVRAFCARCGSTLPWPRRVGARSRRCRAWHSRRRPGPAAVAPHLRRIEGAVARDHRQPAAVRHPPMTQKIDGAVYAAAGASLRASRIGSVHRGGHHAERDIGPPHPVVAAGRLERLATNHAPRKPPTWCESITMPNNVAMYFAPCSFATRPIVGRHGREIREADARGK